jgi:hypothetical protein
MFFRHCSCESLTTPALPKKKSRSKKVFFLRCSYETQTSPALQKKTGSKKMCFFSMSLVNCGGNLLAFKNKNLRGHNQRRATYFQHCSYETQTSPAFKKNKFSGSKKMFLFLFRMSLVKSANSTSLPRFSSLQIAQIAQMHTIHN